MMDFYDLGKGKWREWERRLDQCQKVLAAQQRIEPGNPGTMLKDVETFLAAVGPKGVVSQSKNATLPSEMLLELNARMSQPLEIPLQRSLLRDYHNIAGIFVLLRTMGLLEAKGRRVAISAAALERWRGLNATEQYFALLEALVFEAQSSVLGGERRRSEPQSFETFAIFLGQLSESWQTFEDWDYCRGIGPQGPVPPWSLFVMQQLGLVELGQRQVPKTKSWSPGGCGWVVGHARRTPWGTAVTWGLLTYLLSQQAELKAEGEEDSEVDEPMETDVESSHAAGFGSLQPLFQPFLPEWRKIYTLAQREERKGTHYFKVALVGWQGNGSVWRRLAVPPDATLDDLAYAILDAFKFDDDHLFDFRYRDQRGRDRVYNHPYTDEGPFVTEITVGKCELAIKGAMQFTFDYGDNWQFDVRLEKVEDTPSRLSKLKVVESAGKAPKQYDSSGW